MKLLIDLGGTNIKFANYDGKITDKFSIPTEAQLGFDHVANNIIKTIKSKKINYEEVIISQAGIVDKNFGTFYANDNLPGFTGNSLAEKIKSAFKINAFIFNDAKSSAAYIVKTADVNDALVITIGTGVGTVLITNKEIIVGEHGMTGEAGQMQIGNQRLDQIMSINSMLVAIRKSITDFDLKNIHSIDEKIVINEYKKYVDIIATWTLNLVFILGSTNIFYGGALNLMGDKFLEDVKKAILKKNDTVIGQSIHLQYAPEGNDANLLGALALRERLQCE